MQMEKAPGVQSSSSGTRIDEKAREQQLGVYSELRVHKCAVDLSRGEKFTRANVATRAYTIRYTSDIME